MPGCNHVPGTWLAYCPHHQLHRVKLMLLLLNLMVVDNHHHFLHHHVLIDHFFMRINRTHMILYLSVLEFLINPSNTFPFNFLQIDVLYQGPPVIHSESYVSISYCNCSCVSIIHNIPTWCNIVFNTKVVIISWYVVFIISTSIIVSFPPLLHLIDIFSCIFINPPWTIPTFNLKN